MGVSRMDLGNPLIQRIIMPLSVQNPVTSLHNGWLIGIAPFMLCDILYSIGYCSIIPYGPNQPPGVLNTEQIYWMSSGPKNPTPLATKGLPSPQLSCWVFHTNWLHPTWAGPSMGFPHLVDFKKEQLARGIEQSLLWGCSSSYSMDI